MLILATRKLSLVRSDLSHVCFSVGYSSLIFATVIALFEEAGIISVTYDIFFIGSAVLIGSASLGIALQLRKAAKTAVINSAVARTTQALAHDVRKPFSMFKMIIDLVEGTEDAQKAKILLVESLPEVHRAMASVNGMIQDVMEVGGESKLVCEPTNSDTLIDTTIGDVFRVYPDSDIGISYDLKHTRKVSVDTLKVNRVFSNIVGNAVQAINFRGNIWLKTREISKGRFVEFCVGNAGSFIPKESLPKLFEAFFTSEKKGGTGLGLAIAQKIVLAHGGRIWCESTKTDEFPDGKVEFFFTLPATTEPCSARALPLPDSSKAISSTIENLRKQAGKQPSESDEVEDRLEKDILTKLEECCGTVAILIVDDEAVYRNALSNLITRSEELGKKITIHTAANSSEAIALAGGENHFLSILDVDLGPDSKSGIETVKSLRQKGFTGRVCIHSNRFLVDDYKTAIDAGANTVLPKPMSRAHFLKVILEALEIRSPKAAPNLANHSILPEVVVIDDTAIFRKAWEMKLRKEVVFHGFDGAHSFWKKVESDPGFLSRIHCVITDFYFAEGEVQTGVDVGARLKKLGYSNPVLLASGGDFELQSIRSAVDYIIPKDTMAWPELKAIIEKIEHK